MRELYCLYNPGAIFRMYQCNPVRQTDLFIRSPTAYSSQIEGPFNRVGDVVVVKDAQTGDPGGVFELLLADSQCIMGLLVVGDVPRGADGADRVASGAFAFEERLRLRADPPLTAVGSHDAMLN